MTVQERIDCEMIISRYKDGNWREGTMDELIQDYPFIEEYLPTPYIVSSYIAILKSKTEDKFYNLYLYTDKREYYIVIKPDYMGCQYSCRYQEPLEDWTRGRDLPDGKCNKQTLLKILLAIMGTELVRFDDRSKPPIKYKELSGKKPVVDDVRNNVEFTC